MAAEYNEDLDCPEGISVGNWIWGDIVMTEITPNQANYIDVTGLNPEGEGDYFIQASIKSAYPWSAARAVGVSSTEDDHVYDDPTSFRIWFYRTTGAATRIHWMMWRNVT